MTVVRVSSAEKQTKEIIHKIGNWYKHIDSGELYILCSVGSNNNVSLVCVNDGVWWVSPFYVVNIKNITKEEMCEICAGNCFYFINSVTITED